MIELLIYLSFLMGKIHGQDVIIPHVINVHFVTPATFYGETQPIITAPLDKPQFEVVNSVRFRDPVQREEYIDGSGYNFNPTPPKLPVKYEKISQKGMDRMNRPPNATPNTSVVHATRKASDNTNRQIQPEEKGKPVSKQPSSVPQTSHNTEKTPFVLPPTMNETVIDPSTNETYVQPVDKNGTKVTIPSRSSFNGDQCPTGQVKVNGKCVQED